MESIRQLQIATRHKLISQLQLIKIHTSRIQAIRHMRLVQQLHIVEVVEVPIRLQGQVQGQVHLLR